MLPRALDRGNGRCCKARLVRVPDDMANYRFDFPIEE
jgi:hypothetical protein